MTPRRLPLLLAVTSALVLAGDLVLVVQRSGDEASVRTQAADPSATPVAKSPSPSPTPTESGLAGRYAAPPWPRVSDTLADTGPVDLAEAVKIDGEGAASEQFLKRLGFRQAHIRSWARVSANTYITTLLYEFATPAGAVEFAEGVYLARAESGKPGEALAPRGVRTLRDPPNSEGDVLRYSIYARGTRVALVTLLTSNPAPAEAIEVWRDVVAAQAAKL